MTDCSIAMLVIFYFSCSFFTLGLTLEIPDPGAWRTIEALAEEHPYIAAILNHEKEYVCTGVVIDKRAILSSGACVTPDPYFVTVGTAVLNTRLSDNSRLFKVAYSKLHSDFIFDIHEHELNISRMHSNIGVVFTVLPILDYFFESAILSNYYASELKDKQLIMVGFGNMTNSVAVVLQQQAYHQMPCKNPKWYYCVCGMEYSAMSYAESFGEGGPVLYDNEVVGIAASPSGSLTAKPNINYNIFTVIGPYIAWIDKTKLDSVVEFISEPLRNNDICKISSTALMYIPILFIKIAL